MKRQIIHPSKERSTKLHYVKFALYGLALVFKKESVLSLIEELLLDSSSKHKALSMSTLGAITWLSWEPEPGGGCVLEWHIWNQFTSLWILVFGFITDTHVKNDHH